MFDVAREADDAANTILMLASQVGVKCSSCAKLLRRDDVGGFAFMAPMGSHDFKMHCYCFECAQALQG